MSKKYDATLKVLYEVSPLDWPRFFGYPATAAGPIDSDMSVSSGAADKASLVQGDPPWIMHLEFQSGPDQALPARMNFDSVVLRENTGHLVRSAVILLHPKANLRSYTGLLTEQFPNETEPYRTFRYRVVRLWEIPAEQLLSGGPTLAALAPLTNDAQANAEAVVEAMQARFATIADQQLVDNLWVSVRVLMGLRFTDEVVERLLREVKGMEDSTTYQAIMKKGEARGEARGLLSGERNALRVMGEARFGPIPQLVMERLNGLTDTAVLEELIRYSATATSWDEVLARLP